MNTISMLTCFAYHGTNDRYDTFPDEFIRSDLRRLVALCNNKLGCKINNLYILTDISPYLRVQNQIINEYKTIVDQYCIGKGIIDYPKYIGDKNCFEWILDVCNYISPKRGLNVIECYKEINKKFRVCLKTSNIIEFCNCFTNITFINNKYQYMKKCKYIFLKTEGRENFYFYFTGHGTSRNGLSLVIPTGKKPCHLLNGNEIDELIEKYISDNVKCTWILDCCNSGEIISFKYRLPRKVKTNIYRDYKEFKNKKMLSISSCVGDESCCFYEQYPQGSLFSKYFLDECENEFPLSFDSILTNVQININNYRKKINKNLHGKKMGNQTITIQATDHKFLERGIFPI